MGARRTPAPSADAPGALVIVDLVNPLDFDGGARLLRQALPAARRLARLKARLKRAGWAAVYVNDNFTQWRNDFREQVAVCSRDDCLGAPLVRAVPPQHDDYDILKPRHSAFFDTPLELLLAQLGVRRVALAGIAGDACVVASAIGAHMRQLDVTVVRDCTASITGARNAAAMKLLKDMEIDVRAASAVA